LNLLFPVERERFAELKTRFEAELARKLDAVLALPVSVEYLDDPDFVGLDLIRNRSFLMRAWKIRKPVKSTVSTLFSWW
jgi:hypothetical protein